jgi:hypothetical protein
MLGSVDIGVSTRETSANSPPEFQGKRAKYQHGLVTKNQSHKKGQFNLELAFFIHQTYHFNNSG